MKTFIKIQYKLTEKGMIECNYETIKVSNKKDYVPIVGTRITVKGNSYHVLATHYDFDESVLTINVR